MRLDDGQTDRFPRLGLFVVLFAIVQVQMGRRAREQHCTSPGATTGNNRKHAKRPRAGKKAGGYGEEFMLYCIYDEKTKKYERCGPITKGREQDSRVHRFDREIGFETPAAAVASDCQDPVIKAARDAQRNDVTSVIDSHSDRRTKQGFWERYVLERHAVGQPHHKWLMHLPVRGHKPLTKRQVKDLKEKWGGMHYEAPSEGLVLAYAQAQMARQLKVGPIITTIACISATCTEFGQPTPMADGRLYAQLKRMKAKRKNNNDESSSFDVASDGPRLWAACWNQTGER